jgi:energy-converting hydrogenase Eha subunit B
MTVPKSFEECKQRARAAAEAELDEDEYADTYARELAVMQALMDDDTDGHGIPCRARELVELCRRLRAETGAPSTLGIAVGTIIEAGEARYGHDPDLALAEIVAALIEIFGVDKVRAAIKQRGAHG